MAKTLTKTIENTEYTFQLPPFRDAAAIEDRTRNKFGVTNSENLYRELMKHIVVKPKVNFEYFDEKMEEKEKIVDVDGTEYKLRFPGHKVVSQIEDRTRDGRGVTQFALLYEELMKHVIVEPSVSYDYFDERGNPKEFNELMAEARSFIQNTEFHQVMASAARFLKGKEE